MEITKVIDSADSLAHIAANVSGKLDMSPRQTHPELLYKQMQEWAKELVDAAGAYWKSKGSDEDGMPPEKMQRKILDIEGSPFVKGDFDLSDAKARKTSLDGTQDLKN